MSTSRTRDRSHIQQALDVRVDGRVRVTAISCPRIFGVGISAPENVSAFARRGTGSLFRSEHRGHQSDKKGHPRSPTLPIQKADSDKVTAERRRM